MTSEPSSHYISTLLQTVFEGDLRGWAKIRRSEKHQQMSKLTMQEISSMVEGRLLHSLADCFPNERSLPADVVAAVIS